MAQENQNVNVVSTKVWTIIDYKLFKKQLNMKFRINQLWGSIFLMSMLCVSCISPKEEPIPNYHVLTGDVANYQYDAISAMTYADRPITPMDMGLKGDVVNVEYTSRQGTIYSYSFDPNTSYLQKIEQITPIYTGSMLNATTYFLYDENICKRIVDSASIDRDTLVIEIGPGGGAISKYIIDKCGYLVMYEIDERLISGLDNLLCGYNNYEIIVGDFLKEDINVNFNRNKKYTKSYSNNKSILKISRTLVR